MTDDSTANELTTILSEEQISQFAQDGVLVVDGIFSQHEVLDAMEGLSQTLLSCADVDTSRLLETGYNLKQLSSTNGSGGVLDIFYEPWKLQLSTNPKLFHATQQLWQGMYYHHGEIKPQEKSKDENDVINDEMYKWHPYGPFDISKGYAYIDRIGYRLPTELAIKLGEQQQLSRHSHDKQQKKISSTNVPIPNNKQEKQKKKTPIQRCLTPHFDCCPEDLYSDKNKKWRPIQCFVSLSDTLEPDHGGFEAAKGFHRDFHSWVTSRKPTTIVRRRKKTNKRNKRRNEKQQDKDGEKYNHAITGNDSKDETETISFPPPCIGEYSHIRPKEDKDVMDRICHIPNIRAGSVVFWDHRIPHANAYYHHGSLPRSVVYCSFLPDVPLNRTYVANQWHKWKVLKQTPNDQWIGDGDGSGDSETPEASTTATEADSKTISSPQQHDQSLDWATPLARKLLGLDLW